MLFCIFFFKQKTAYEMRISDWSSDVCSSDLGHIGIKPPALLACRRVQRDHNVLGRADIKAIAVLERRILRAVSAFRSFRRQIPRRSEEHTSELQSLMRLSYAVFCLTITPSNLSYYILVATLILFQFSSYRY